MVAGTARAEPAGKVRFRRRPDLEAHPQWFRGRRYWVVKDPVALNYVKLRDEEFAILQMLDGKTAEATIRERFQRQFAPLQLSGSRLQSFLGTLHRAGLVLSDASGQGEQLYERGRRQKARERLAACSNILAIRFRGIDPEPLLNWSYPRLRWLFSRWFQALWLAVLAAALALVAVHFDELRRRLPDLTSLLTGPNLLWMAVTLAGVKILHEAGHALACRHYGGECHELGLMLLVFTPCLYCNVSDSWTLPNKWQRVAISAAGIYVEVFLASVCTIVWWFSQPGLLNTICLNVMLLGSLNTLLLNGNPLLRYDGYYVLSDAVELPNLWQESRAVLHAWLGRILLGWSEPLDPRQSRAERWQLAAYGIASSVYRMIVLVTILFLVFELLGPLGLKPLAQLILFSVLLGVVVMPMSRVVGLITHPIRRRRTDPRRLAMVTLATTGLAAAVFLVPLPYRVHAPMVLEPREAGRVYAAVEGRLDEALPEGRRVRAGEVVARLTRDDLQRQLRGLESEVSQLALRLENLESLRLRDPSAAQQLPAVRERLYGKRQELIQQQRDVDRLILRAPRDGIVLAPPWQPAPRADAGPSLGRWSGTPLEASNQGCLLETNTLVCLVANPERLDAMLYIEQSDREFVRPEQRVRLIADCLPGRVLQGTIREVAEIDVDNVPSVLAQSGRLPTRSVPLGWPPGGPTNQARPLETLYQARVELDDTTYPLTIHSCGSAKVLVAPRTLGNRLARYLRQTFGG